MPQKEKAHTHKHTLLFQQEDGPDACTTLMFPTLLLWTGALSSYLHPSAAICDSLPHQIFTVGPIKHSPRSTFICPPPSSLQRVRQKPTKSLETCAQSACMVGDGRRRRRLDKTENCTKRKKLAQGEETNQRETRAEEKSVRSTPAFSERGEASRLNNSTVLLRVC